MKNRLFKPGVVLAGYGAALVAACGVFILMTWNRTDQDSGGMQAFGDLMLFAGLFGLFALAPTALALFFLRPFERFWSALSIASLTFAATGPIAAFIIPRLDESNWMLVVAAFAPLRVLGAPLLGLGFLIFAVIAPNRRSRWAMLAAAAIEAVAGAYAYFCLLVLGHWLL
jgi:hypothetical protein